MNRIAIRMDPSRLNPTLTKIAGVSFGISWCASVCLNKMLDKRLREQREMSIKLHKAAEHLAHIIDRNNIELDEFDVIVLADIVGAENVTEKKIDEGESNSQ